MLFLLVTATRGAFLQAKSLAETIASTSQMTIGICKGFREWHMEALMWECFSWQEGLSHPFHSVWTTLVIIQDQFGSHLVYVGRLLSFF